MKTEIKVHKKQVAFEVRGEMWNTPDNLGGSFASRLSVSTALDVSIKSEDGARRAARRWEALVQSFLDELGAEEW